MILRFTLVFFLIVSVLGLIQMLGEDTTYQADVLYGPSRAERDLQTAWIVLAVWHCAVGLVVVFLKIKPWQLQLLATLINVPVVMFLSGSQHVLGSFQYWIFAYLDLWLIFLLARWPPTYKLIGFLNDEIHYYLID